MFLLVSIQLPRPPPIAISQLTIDAVNDALHHIVAVALVHGLLPHIVEHLMHWEVKTGVPIVQWAPILRQCLVYGDALQSQRV